MSADDDDDMVRAAFALERRRRQMALVPSTIRLARDINERRRPRAHAGTEHVTRDAEPPTTTGRLSDRKLQSPVETDVQSASSDGWTAGEIPHSSAG